MVQLQNVYNNDNVVNVVNFAISKHITIKNTNSTTQQQSKFKWDFWYRDIQITYVLDKKTLLKNLWCVII
jgi:hypothetical protein